MAITPTVIAVVKGAQTPLVLSAQHAAANAVAVDASWTSSSPSIATVSKDGVITGGAYGTAAIHATVRTHSASPNVVVGTLDVGAFIWQGDGRSLLTNAATDPAWTITAADEINNRGQILVTADNSDGRQAAP